MVNTPSPINSKNPILKIRDLQLGLMSNSVTTPILNGISMDLDPGRSVAIVGESGCGKTMTALSILQLLPNSAQLGKISRIEYKTRSGQTVDIAKLGPRSAQMRRIRGKEISMVFQEPISALSPVHTILDQVGEVLHVHTKMNRKEIRNRVIELLHLVGIPQPNERADQYPFQLSGGMKQRVMIAMAIALEPQILIADEPTTALDVTIQAQVLQLIKRMQDQLGLALILISHDLGIVTHMTDEIMILYLGQVVESGPTKAVVRNPSHPYTKALLNSIPKMTGPKHRLKVIQGSVPSLYAPPSGCPFSERCEENLGEICSRRMPIPINLDEKHWVRCYARGSVEPDTPSRKERCQESATGTNQHSSTSGLLDHIDSSRGSK